jgi:antibiotic biosynthesis monooxygenase (ABM) superfamily enzyme
MNMMRQSGVRFNELDDALAWVNSSQRLKLDWTVEMLRLGGQPITQEYYKQCVELVAAQEGIGAA